MYTCRHHLFQTDNIKSFHPVISGLGHESFKGIIYHCSFCSALKLRTDTKVEVALKPNPKTTVEVIKWHFYELDHKFQVVIKPSGISIRMSQ